MKNVNFISCKATWHFMISSDYQYIYIYIYPKMSNSNVEFTCLAQK
jgi:hypothetical protein